MYTEKNNTLKDLKEWGINEISSARKIVCMILDGVKFLMALLYYQKLINNYKIICK